VVDHCARRNSVAVVLVVLDCARALQPTTVTLRAIAGTAPSYVDFKDLRLFQEMATDANTTVNDKSAPRPEPGGALLRNCRLYFRMRMKVVLVNTPRTPEAVTMVAKP